uniref:Cadherin domain-containing protein n=1 Tax=Chelydra serpentina TaxID=8475 RepID=A0A8C3S749_CHESE
MSLAPTPPLSHIGRVPCSHCPPAPRPYQGGSLIPISSLPDGDPAQDFSLDPVSGVFSTSRSLDRELVASYHLTVVARDHGTPQRSATMSLSVRVLDLNDNAPHFAQAAYTVEVPEDLAVGALVLQLVALDPDEGTNGQVSYYLGNESLGMFRVEPQSGRITSAQALDRERRPTYSFLAKAVDSAPWEPKSAVARVTITVRDINDHAPAFLHSPLSVNLSRHTPPKQVVATMRAEDKDAGANASILYRFATPNPSFAINSYTGAIQLLQPLGSLSQRQRTLFILATDLGQPALSSTGVVVIYLQEESYQGVRFPRSTRDVAIPENAATGTVTSQTGHRALDFEAVPFYNLTVAALDRGVPQRSATVPVLVAVLDVNDNPPVFARAEYHTAVSESTPPGTELLRLAAHDADSGSYGQVRYSISSGDQRGLFQLHEATGTLRLAQPLDRETQARHSLVVQASDGPGGHFALVPITIEVKDTNDNTPYFPVETLSASVRENLPPGTLVTTLRAIDADTGAFGELRYAVLEQAVGELGAPEGRDVFFLNRTSGELRSRLAFDYERAKAFQLAPIGCLWWCRSHCLKRLPVPVPPLVSDLLSHGTVCPEWRGAEVVSSPPCDDRGHSGPRSSSPVGQAAQPAGGGGPASPPAWDLVGGQTVSQRLGKHWVRVSEGGTHSKGVRGAWASTPDIMPCARTVLTATRSRLPPLPITSTL